MVSFELMEQLRYYFSVPTSIIFQEAEGVYLISFVRESLDTAPV